MLEPCIQCQPTAAACRAARYCHSAAHGGQILMPMSIAREFVTFCSGQTLSLDTSGPAVRLGLLGAANSAFSSFKSRRSSTGMGRTQDALPGRQVKAVVPSSCQAAGVELAVLLLLSRALPCMHAAWETLTVHTGEHAACLGIAVVLCRSNPSSRPSCCCSHCIMSASLLGQRRRKLLSMPAMHEQAWHIP